MSVDPSSTTPHLSRARNASALAVPGLLSFTVPLVGFLASLLLPLFAARARPRLWPQITPVRGHLYAAFALTGLWLPALLAVASGGRVGSEATTWLILPLCAPAGSSLVVPAGLAVTVYLGGVAAAAILSRPWPWVAGAWAAPLAYSAAGRWLVDFACVA